MDGQRVLLSFIIPLYNCEKYIERCLRSISNIDLTEEDYEIVVVDDGSSDNGSIICKKYRETHSNLHLFQQKNAGASSARNKGLDLAKGKWIWFVDADDQIDIEINELLPTISSCGDAEIICFNYSIEEKISLRRVQIFNKSYSTGGVEYLKFHHRLYLWDKLFSRSAIGNIRFLEGTKNIEDMLFCLEVLVNVKNMLCYSKYGYIYNNLNVFSTSRRRDKRNLIKLDQDTILVHSALKKLINQYDGKKARVLSEIENFSIVGHLYSLMSFYNLKRFRSAITRYRKLKCYPLRMTYNKKANFFVLLINCETIACFLKRILDKIQKR